MDEDTQAMARVIDRLMEAGWISSGRVSDGALLVQWTPAGRAAIPVLWRYRTDFAYLPEREDECLAELLLRALPPSGGAR